LRASIPWIDTAPFREVLRRYQSNLEDAIALTAAAERRTARGTSPLAVEEHPGAGCACLVRVD